MSEHELRAAAQRVLAAWASAGCSWDSLKDPMIALRRAAAAEQAAQPAVSELTPEPPSEVPAPAELRELAARADDLGTAIDAVQARLRAAADQPTRLAGFRLDEAAGAAKQVGGELTATASDLARVRGRSDCRSDWGVCQEHGNTLTSSGGQSWCRTPECGRAWDYDRAGLPCTEPAAFTGRDAEGDEFLVCAGHAIDVRERLIGTTLIPLSQEGPTR